MDKAGKVLEDNVGCFGLMTLGIFWVLVFMLVVLHRILTVLDDIAATLGRSL